MSKLPTVKSCDGCGVCCFHMGYPPFVRPDGNRDGEKWWYRLPEDLRRDLDAYIAEYEHREYGDTVDTFDGPCYWLDLETRHCKHHEHRPNVCRDFETGSRQCHQWRNHYQKRIQS